MAGANVPYDHLPFFYSDLFALGYEAVELPAFSANPHLDIDEIVNDITGATPASFERLFRRRSPG